MGHTEDGQAGRGRRAQGQASRAGTRKPTIGEGMDMRVLQGCGAHTARGTQLRGQWYHPAYADSHAPHWSGTGRNAHRSASLLGA